MAYNTLQATILHGIIYCTTFYFVIDGNTSLFLWLHCVLSVMQNFKFSIFKNKDEINIFVHVPVVFIFLHYTELGIAV